MKKNVKGQIILIAALVLMSTILAVGMYWQERTVLMVLWAAVAIMHMVRLGILVWQNRENRKGDREE